MLVVGGGGRRRRVVVVVDHCRCHRSLGLARKAILGNRARAFVDE